MKDLIEALNRAHKLDESYEGDDIEYEYDQTCNLFDCVKLNDDRWVVIVGFENYEYIGLPERSIKNGRYDTVRFTELDIKWLVTDPDAEELINMAKYMYFEHEGAHKLDEAMNKKHISEDFQQVGSYPYMYVSEDPEVDYSEEICNKYNWDEMFDRWKSNPRSVPKELWLRSKAVITKEDGWYQVSYGGLDDYEEFDSLASCKKYVASQYDIFKWTRATKSQPASSKSQSQVVPDSYPRVTPKDERKFEFDEKGRCIYDGSVTFLYRDMFEYIVVKDGTKKIEDYAFIHLPKLKSVQIPDSVTLIGDGAFEHCPNLISIEIPNSVTHIGLHAFAECENLRSVTIPDSVKYLGPHAFRLCPNLTVTCSEGSLAHKRALEDRVSVNLI